MNFFKRATRYCFRQKVRSLLLLLIFTLLSTTILITLSSEKAIQQGTKEIKESVGASVRIEIDTANQENYGALEEYGEGTAGYVYNGDFITQKMLDKISKLSGVISYNAKSSDGFWGTPKSFKPFPAMFTEGLATPYQAVLDSSLDTKFLNGTYKLEVGRHIEAGDSYVTMISKELADKNNLGVGDEITFSVDGAKTSTFTIVGIFSGTEGMTQSAITPDGIPANIGYIDFNSLKEMYELEGYDYLDVYTNSSENAQKLMETIKSLPEFKDKTFSYNINSEDFDMVSTSLSSFGEVVDTAVLLITVVGMLVIILLLVLWIRSRKKEIGILLAIGRSKIEIIGQFLVENILIALLSMLATTVLSLTLADKIGLFMLSKAGESVGDLTVHVELSDMLTVYSLGLIVVCLAVVFASSTVFRLKPKDILTKMD